MTSINRDKAISDIVREDYRTADVFKKHGINYCCGGQVTLGQGCLAGNVCYDQLLEELTEATRFKSHPNSVRFDQWKIEFLVDYIINVHHAYLHDAIPSIENRLLGFMEGHKKKYPELENIYVQFSRLGVLLSTHNRHEEDVIFPYIKQMDAAYRRKEVYGSLFVRTLRKPLKSVEKEHEDIKEALENLQTAANGYQYPQNGCINHQVVYHMLREFHDDLIQHKHLENNILFPKAIAIEQQLLRG